MRNATGCRHRDDPAPRSLLSVAGGGCDLAVRQTAAVQRVAAAHLPTIAGVVDDAHFADSMRDVDRVLAANRPVLDACGAVVFNVDSARNSDEHLRESDLLVDQLASWRSGEVESSFTNLLFQALCWQLNLSPI